MSRIFFAGHDRGAGQLPTLGFPRPAYGADTAPPFLWACFDRKRQADDTSVSAARYDFHPAIRTGCGGVYHPGIAAHCPVVGCSLNCRLGIVPVFHGCRGRKDRARPPFCPADRSDAGAECSGSYPTGRILISPPESRAVQGADAATELLPGASCSGPGHGFRIPNPGYAGRYRICCPMHAIPGIPRRTGSGCRYRNSCPARFAPARGTVFGYRYEKRCLFRFIRNISFPGSLRAARERMPLLKLLPGGVSPRPGTSGFFIPSPACRFSPARC